MRYKNIYFKIIITNVKYVFIFSVPNFEKSDASIGFIVTCVIFDDVYYYLTSFVTFWSRKNTYIFNINDNFLVQNLS